MYCYQGLGLISHQTDLVVVRAIAEFLFLGRS